jgi:drug/metabolite transporter (DMT)-like permease
MTPTAIAATTLSSVFWSLFDFSRKKLAARLEPVPVVIWLMLLQTPIFVPFMFTEAWTLPPAEYYVPAIASLLLNIFANVLFVLSMRLAPLSLAVPMLSLGPVFSATAGFLLLGEEVSVRQLIGIAIVVVSAFALGRAGARAEAAKSADLPKSRGLSQVGRGLVMMTAVAALWSTTPVLDKICLRTVASSEHAFLQCLAIALCLMAWTGWRSRGANDSGTTSTSLQAVVRLSQLRENALWLGGATVVAAAALLTQFWAIQLVAVGIFESLKRAVGMLSALILGLVFLNEPVTLPKALAIGGMAVGVFILLA